MKLILILISLSLHSCILQKANLPAKMRHTMDLKTTICNLPWANELPMASDSEPVQVDFRASLWNLARINEKDQIIEFRLEISMAWSNPFMAWNASEYGGVSEITCGSASIWTPDVYMLANEDTNDKHSNELGETDIPVKISSGGSSVMDGFYMFEATCRLHLYYFPYDNQTCVIRFVSWSYDKTRLVLRARPEGVLETHADYKSNGDWTLTRLSLSSREVMHWETAEFTEITLTMEMDRISASYTIDLVIPCTIISCLSLLVFLLPEESGEKVGLCITILLALTVFQQLTSDQLPYAGMPYISKFYLIVVVMNALSLVVTSVTLVFYHSRSRAPLWLRIVIVKWLGTCMCVRTSRERRDQMESERRDRKESKIAMREADAASPPNSDPIENGVIVYKSPPGPTEMGSREPKPSTGFTMDNSATNSHKRRRSANNREADELNSWLDINRVLNRFFFFLFLFIMVIAFMILFLRTEGVDVD